MRNRRIAVLTALVLIIACLAIGVRAASFPEKPIRIVNYVAPGGVMDITTRKFVDIASKYTKAVFVVENKPGAGGLTGMEYVIEAPNDGYTVFAATSSNIITVVSTQSNQDRYVWSFQWISMLMRDPECVITSVNNTINTWVDIVSDAVAKKGSQIWVGPSTGGNDHLVALKLWDRAGIKAKWVPFESGPAAMAALMGGVGVAYVGNPADITGRPDLKIAAVCAPNRLKQFPDVPTFKELGISGVEDEIMWRGFAVEKGTPKEAVEWLQALVDKVYADPEWIKFFEDQAIEVTNYREERFTQIIKMNIADSTAYLKAEGLIK
ncbi:MAG TPA: tripartite tricarboxylate transporter substrate binding protein [Bacillota bacterium]|nr:MAG: Tripartite tricarboxylate transporter family receptor [Firmicutes bacterium ADurb.Bin153]HNV34283.1 tripartite tricarboxylate transporter substrate binding protein [Bacillota bacterium]